MTTERDPVETRIRQALEVRAAGLDAATRSRLARARSRAITGRARFRGRPGWLAAALPLAAAATLAAVAITVYLVIPQPGDEPPAAYAAEELILDVGDADLDLVAELDFYDWLALARSEDDPS